MTLSRRKAIALIGGGTILAAGAATTGFLATRTPTRALAPWAAAGGYDDPRKRALSFALLVPNPHNLQPWLVDLEGDDALSLYHDPSRRIPYTDPFDRQITIGLGCFLEQLVIAASVDGQHVDLSLYPNGPDGPVARAVFSQGAQADPLASAIMDRRSCKEPFADKPVEASKADTLAPYAAIHIDQATVDALRDLTLESWLVEWETPRTRIESIDLMRLGKAQINANPDGIDLGGPFLESLMLVGLLRLEDQNDPSSAGYKQGVDIYRKMLMATSAYAVLVSDGNSRVDQINAGRRWLRLNLATTQMGLALHPVSQCLQEYPEMATHYARAHDLLAKPGQTVQMLGRLGYGPKTAPSPRWPLEAKLRKQLMQEQDRALLFGAFTEIGIIDQLARALLEARLPKGLLSSHFIVLNHLMRVADGRTMVELARAFQLPKTSVTHTVAVLEKRGLVDVRPNPNDRRSKCVWLTDAGRALRDETIAAMAPDFETLAAGVNIDRLRDVLPVLTELRVFMDHQRNAEPPRDRPVPISPKGR